jgi:hypothetical protein
MGFLSDVVNGKEKKLKADPLAAPINAAAQQGAGYLQSGGSKLNDIYNQDPTQFVNNQIGIENKLMRGATDDAVRRTRQLITQRGMGNSSVGLGTEVNQKKQLNDQLALNNASGVSRMREMGIQNGQGIMNTGNALLAPKLSQGVQMQDQTYRTGGFGQLLAAGVQGGMMAMGK